MPGTATQKFGRMAKRLGIDAELKNWRHYNATELIAAGVDVNVVGARLGHGGGGSIALSPTPPTRPSDPNAPLKP
jgi:integrase